MSGELESLEQRLGYRFRDRGLLITAVTHRSYATEHDTADNERLEFLGDAVLATVVAELLMAEDDGFDEGELSRRRAALVRAEALASRARTLGLGSCLRLGRGEERDGGRDKTRLLAAAYEALLGAMFQDGGYPAVRDWLADRFGEDQEASVASRDSKTELQERTQAEAGLLPDYEVIEVSGPGHEPVHRVRVSLAGEVLGEGRGRTRKAAEQAAARAALVGLDRERRTEPSQ